MDRPRCKSNTVHLLQLNHISRFKQIIIITIKLSIITVTTVTAVIIVCHCSIKSKKLLDLAAVDQAIHHIHHTDLHPHHMDHLHHHLMDHPLHQTISSHQKFTPNTEFHRNNTIYRNHLHHTVCRNMCRVKCVEIFFK